MIWKLAFLKLIVPLLASMGIYLPSSHVYICQRGHTPRSAPSTCETVPIQRGY